MINPSSPPYTYTSAPVSVPLNYTVCTVPFSPPSQNSDSSIYSLKTISGFIKKNDVPQLPSGPPGMSPRPHSRAHQWRCCSCRWTVGWRALEFAKISAGDLELYSELNKIENECLRLKTYLIDLPPSSSVRVEIFYNMRPDFKVFFSRYFVG